MIRSASCSRSLPSCPLVEQLDRLSHRFRSHVSSHRRGPEGHVGEAQVIRQTHGIRARLRRLLGPGRTDSALVRVTGVVDGVPGFQSS